MDDILRYLTEGNYEEFKSYFKKIVIDKFSYMDVVDNNAENFYHAFVLGMLVGLQETHIIKSNRESGHGRYDIMVKPKDKQKRAFIMEFKIADDAEENSMEKSIAAAFKQIEDKKYEAELLEEGYTNLVKMAFAFKGKECKIEVK